MNLLYKIIQTAAAMWLGMQLTAGYVTYPVPHPAQNAGRRNRRHFICHHSNMRLSHFWRSLCLFQTATCLPLLVGFGTLATLSL